jgi:hypothetical protein
MSIRTLLLFVASVPLLGGCGEVIASAPMGETPVSVSKDDWEGMWVWSEGSIAIKVLDEAAGVLLVSLIEVDKEPPTVEPMEMRLSKTGGWTFANWEEEPGAFSWLRVERVGETILAWSPDFSRFEELVDEGILPGEVRSRGDPMGGGQVVLDTLTEEHLDIITGSSQGVLFDWDEPVAAFRVVGPERGRTEVTGGSRYLLTTENLAPYASSDAHEAVNRLRRFWLKGVEGRPPRVFVNGVETGDPTSLRDYATDQVLEMRFLRSEIAVARYGADYGGGVIEVIMGGEK